MLRLVDGLFEAKRTLLFLLMTGPLLDEDGGQGRGGELGITAEPVDCLLLDKGGVDEI